MAVKTLKEFLMESENCLVAPCVYDCASSRAVAMVGFKAMMLSGVELSLAMDGMLEHSKRNSAQQGFLYTCDKKDATGIYGDSATPLFDPRSYMELEKKFTEKTNNTRLLARQSMPSRKGSSGQPLKTGCKTNKFTVLGHHSDIQR